ncbi:hypothetical protein B0H15DRAFT_657133 [Mycena belliarum]|uniref:Uncharacterized protein n=1 Tax=Mycena belliarum TaxID=1033014 RepID=A0AAD6XJE1_9AGAR|nr:hypothetical protein B0H15DRAFT_657133 [Mycena belliae]
MPLRARESERHRAGKDAGARLAEQDAEMNRLRLCISTTRARLVAALDALQALKAELASVVRENDRLHSALAQSRRLARDAERARDDLRDSVVALSERAEASTGDWAWAAPRMHISRLLEPLACMPSERAEADDTLWAYAASMLRAVRGALAAERRAHAETREREARREADAAAAGCTCGNRSSSAHPDMGMDTEPDGDPRARLLRKTTLNALLEREVEALAVRLEEARLATKTRVGERPAEDVGPSRSGSASGARSGRPRSPSGSRAHPKRQRSRQSRNRAPSPRGVLPSLPEAADPDPDRTIRPAPRPPSSRSSEPGPSRRAADAGPSRRGPDAGSSGPAAEPETGSAAAGAVPESAHAALDREIAALGAQIDAFHVEREVLVALVEAQHGPSASPSHSPIPDPDLHPATEGNAPDPQPPPPQRTTHPPSLLPPSPPAHPLDDFDGEQSMELATPLVAALVLPPPPRPQQVFAFGAPAAVHAFAFAPPQAAPGELALPLGEEEFAPQAVSTPAEISPLDLSAERPLTRETGPEPPGERAEQAVRELMGIAVARRRGGQ